MAKEKREIKSNAPVREFDNTKNLVTTVKNPLDKDEVFEIIWLIPESDEEAMERYDCTMADLVASGVRNLSYRPDYIESGFVFEETKDADGKVIDRYPVALKEGGHEAMQELADNYRVGRTAQPGQSVKAKAARVAAVEKQLGGMTIEELLAKAKEMGIVASE